MSVYHTIKYCDKGNVHFVLVTIHKNCVFSSAVELLSNSGPSGFHMSVNFFFLSHLLRDNWSDCFETCIRCSLSVLVVFIRKWFQTVNKHGCRQPSLIFTIIASPKPLEKFSRNLAYEFFLMSRYVSPKMIPVRQQPNKQWGKNRLSPRKTAWPPASRTWLVSHDPG